MTGDRRDEFHVGYLDETPPGIRRFARRLALGLLALGSALGLGLALLLERFDEGVFEYGTVREYSGELLVDPHPRLLTADGPAEGYLLVGVGKRGLDVNEAPSPPWTTSPSREAELAGTLIRNPEAAMLEVHSLQLLEGAAGAGPAIDPGIRADPAAHRAARDPELPHGTVEPGVSTGPATREPRLDGGSAGPEPAASPTLAPADSGSASAGPEATPNPPPDAATDVIRVHERTLLGEIVDTKCYLGAMKPGRGKPPPGLRLALYPRRRSGRAPGADE